MTKLEIILIIILAAIIGWMVYWWMTAPKIAGANYHECYEDCSPKPTPTPSPTPVPSFNPCGEVNLEDFATWDEQKPTPMPCPTVTPSPTVVPTETPHQDSFSSPGGPFDAPHSDCTAPVDAPKLTGFGKDKDGNPVFSWWKSTSPNVDDQSIEFGNSQGNLPWGQLHLGKDVNTFTIHDSDHGKPTWARVCSWSNGCDVCSNELDP